MKYPMIYPKAPPMTENIVQFSAYRFITSRLDELANLYNKTKDKKYCEYFDLDFFSTYICKFFQIISIN